MRSLVSQIKTEFENIRSKMRTHEIDSGLGHFWVSNDHFSLAEEGILLPDESRGSLADAKSDLPGGGEKDEPREAKTVNLFVAEPDIFSLVRKLEGDIIICDIDRTLLKFIEEQKNKLLSLYDQYKRGQLSIKSSQTGSSLKDPERQNQFLCARIQEVKTHHFTQRLFDAEKHNIIKIILNVLMVIPLFGGIKWAATGSYFFHADTHRSRMMIESLETISAPSYQMK